MNIRSEIDTPDTLLRLFRLVDTSPLHSYLEARSTVHESPICTTIRSIGLVWEFNGSLYKHYKHEHAGAIVSEDGECLVEYEQDEHTEVLHDYGKRYAKDKRSAPSNLAGRP